MLWALQPFCSIAHVLNALSGILYWLNVCSIVDYRIRRCRYPRKTTSEKRTIQSRKTITSGEWEVFAFKIKLEEKHFYRVLTCKYMLLQIIRSVSFCLFCLLKRLLRHFIRTPIDGTRAVITSWPYNFHLNEHFVEYFVTQHWIQCGNIHTHTQWQTALVVHFQVVL